MALWNGADNFRYDLELDYQDNLRIIAGMNNYASDYTLKPKEELYNASVCIPAVHTR